MDAGSKIDRGVEEFGGMLRGTERGGEGTGGTRRETRERVGREEKRRRGRKREGFRFRNMHRVEKSLISFCLVVQRAERAGSLRSSTKQKT